jgi:hypothetical protein
MIVDVSNGIHMAGCRPPPDTLLEQRLADREIQELLPIGETIARQGEVLLGHPIQVKMWDIGQRGEPTLEHPSVKEWPVKPPRA